MDYCFSWLSGILRLWGCGLGSMMLTVSLPKKYRPVSSRPETVSSVLPLSAIADNNRASSNSANKPEETAPSGDGYSRMRRDAGGIWPG